MEGMRAGPGQDALSSVRNALAANHFEQELDAYLAEMQRETLLLYDGRILAPMRCGIEFWNLRFGKKFNFRTYPRQIQLLQQGAYALAASFGWCRRSTVQRRPTSTSCSTAGGKVLCVSAYLQQTAPTKLRNPAAAVNPLMTFWHPRRRVPSHHHLSCLQLGIDPDGTSRLIRTAAKEGNDPSGLGTLGSNTPNRRPI